MRNNKYLTNSWNNDVTMMQYLKDLYYIINMNHLTKSDL